MLKTLTTTALLAALTLPLDAATTMQAQPFDLDQVRLLDGPFKDAQQRDVAYLLSLEPDRLLSRFRITAGLEPKGEAYGGWEQAGISGHSLGHYLSACALGYAATGDQRLLVRVNTIVDELAECQDANGDGFVSGILEARRAFKEIAEGKIDAQSFSLNGVWVPWYTLHKLFAGLRDAHQLAGSEKAKVVLVKLGDWAVAWSDTVSDADFQKMLDTEHGGMNEVMADLYALTGDEKYLNLSKRFHHKRILEPLAEGRDILPGIHGNTQVPKLIGLARRYELTHDEHDHDAAHFFWDTVVHHHSYAMGGNSEGEYFARPDELARRITVTSAETCNTYNMLKLTRHLFTWEPSSEYADYYERALYNHILVSQDPEQGMFAYYVSLKPGHFITYSTATNAFWCCVGTGMENHVRYGESIYFHNADALWVNLFIASTLDWQEQGVKLTQQTDYPAGDTTRLTVNTGEPKTLTLKLRKPYWATQGFTLKVNGQAAEAAEAAGYVSVTRQWRDGDVIEYTLPMSLHLQPMPDKADRVAIMYGPLVLAGQLGTEGMSAPIPYHDNQTAYFNVTDPQVPLLLTDDKPVEQWVKPVDGQPLTFKTVGVGRPSDVTLVPFYQIGHERYTIYWDTYNQATWEAKLEAERIEAVKLAAWRARMVDELQPGRQQDEVEHNMQGEKTSSGAHWGGQWRQSVGAWFSYDMKVTPGNPDSPLELVATYWGGDRGGRTFDILVDGQVIATQSLNAPKPGEFVKIAYPIPADLIAGKQKITVKFQAHPDNIAGGVFGLAVMKQEQPNNTAE